MTTIDTRTILRVLIIAIGIWLILDGTTHFIDDAFYYGGPQSLFWSEDTSQPSPQRTLHFTFPTTFGWLFQILAGAAIIVFSRPLCRLAGPAGGPHCVACGYNLTKAKGGKCPECGATFAPTVED